MEARRDDAPRAPGMVAWLAVLGGLAGLLAAVPDEGVAEVASAAFERLDPRATWVALRPLTFALTVGPLLGAVTGAAAGLVLTRARAIRARDVARPPRFPLFGALLALPGPLLALAMLPHLLPAPDTGWSLLLAPLASLLVTGAALLPGVLVHRARALAEHRRRRHPEPPPRRDPDEMSPEARAALRNAAVETPPPSA